MTERVEFGSKELADQYREKHEEHLCSEDDARLRTVAFSDDVPEGIIERARLEAQEGRAERESQSVTASLTPSERGKIKDAGALERSWQGYKGGIVDLNAALEEAREAWSHAQQAARAVNRIREAHGQDPIHFERLEELQKELRDWTIEAARDCHECHVGLDREASLSDEDVDVSEGVPADA
jgi:hypothetical protein